MLNLNLNWVSEAIKTLAQWWPIVKSNFQAIQDNFNNHAAGTVDKHDAQHITYSGNVAGATNVKEGIDNLKNRVDQIITTPAEGVTAQEIIDARGGEPTLNARFEVVNTRLTDIVQKVVTIGSDYPAEPHAYQIFFKKM